MTARHRAVLSGLFAATGFSALTLQVVWQRVISMHAGVDLFSITTVVAAFLAGLGIGRLGARRALLAYAVSNAAGPDHHTAIPVHPARIRGTGWLARDRPRPIPYSMIS